MSSWKKEEPEKPSPTFGCPTVGELVSLYAELSEPVNHKAFQKIVDSAADREHNIFVEVRSKGKLVGFLRAWFDPPSGRGVVYEIVVSPERRREHIAKSLLHFLITKKLGDWKGDSRRVTANLDRHLAVVRTMYAVALTFGFQRVVEGSYLQFLRHFSKTLPNDRALPQLSGPITLLLALLFVGLGLLGIRLFWATGNIRRFLLRQTILLNPAKTTSVLFLHFPVLLLHAVLFFFLCRFFYDICWNGLYEANVYGLVWVYVTLLALNVFWLFWLRTGRDGEARKLKFPELMWARNNAAFVLLGLVFLTLFHCLHPCQELGLLGAATLIIANTAINFAYTGRNYILGDAFGGA